MMLKSPISFSLSTLPKNSGTILFGIAYLTPVVLLIWFIARFGVNVPSWDQWELVSLFTKIHEGQATFQDFFVQHNEHRILFPRIIFAILAFTSGWNNKLEMYVSAGLAIATYSLIVMLSRQDKSSPGLFHLTNLLCGAFLLSLGQWENWLWGFQLAWFLVNFCVVLAIACLTIPTQWPLLYRFILAGCSCLVASFSSAHGLFSWLALLPLVVSLPGTQRQRALRGGLWLVAFLLVAAIYQIGYIKPSQHPDLLFFLKEPGLAVTYLLTLLGGILGPTIIRPVLSGAIVLLSFLVFSAYWLFHCQHPIAQKMAPWLSLAWFTLLFAVVTTLGRAGFGVEQAKASRYITVTILLLVSVLQLWRIVLAHPVRVNSSSTGSAFVAGILITLLLANIEQAIAQAKTQATARTEGKICLELIQFLHQPTSGNPEFCLNRLYPDPLIITELSHVLAQLNFRQFPDSQALKFAATPSKGHGYIDSPAIDIKILNSPEEDLLVAGWAILPDRDELPDAVLLSYDHEQAFVAAGSIGSPRPDVAKALGSQQFLYSGWDITLGIKQLPVGEHILKAWVYDRQHKLFVPLQGEPHIRIPSDR